MNKTHIILALIILAFSSCGSGSGSGAKQDSVATSSATVADTTKAATPAPATTIDICALTNDEDSLDFGRGDQRTNYMYTLSELNTGIAAFGNYFKYQVSKAPVTTAPLVNVPSKVKLSEINKRIDEIKKMMSGTGKKYFSALQMHYGIKDKKIIIIYEPIALSNYENSFKKYGYYRCDDVTSTNNFYVANDDGTLKLLDADTKKTLIDSYTGKIYIQHFYKDTKNSIDFITDDANAERGDIHYCTMPIQQVIREYRENIKDCSASNPDDLVSFNIIADNRYYFGKRPILLRRRNYKLHVIVSYGTLRDNGFDGTFNGLSADFGQMCPPNCGWSQIPEFLPRKAR